MANAVDLQQPSGGGDVTRTVEDEPAVSSEELLELLGDEYARQVLRTIADEPMSGQEIADAAEISNATVYRRLEALEDAGLVEGETVINAEGHHYKRYRTVLESVNLRLDGEAVSVQVRTTDEGRSSDGPAYAGR